MRAPRTRPARRPQARPARPESVGLRDREGGTCTSSSLARGILRSRICCRMLICAILRSTSSPLCSASAHALASCSYSCCCCCCCLHLAGPGHGNRNRCSGLLRELSAPERGRGPDVRGGHPGRDASSQRRGGRRGGGRQAGTDDRRGQGIGWVWVRDRMSAGGCRWVGSRGRLVVSQRPSREARVGKGAKCW